jgi:hypothetical protein
MGVATGHEDARRWPMPEYAYAIFHRIDWNADAVARGQERDVRRKKKGLTNRVEFAVMSVGILQT